MIYGLIRFGLIPLALVSWIFYQLFKKKKPFREMQADIMMVIILVAVWVFIYYQFIT
ncbi:MAG TPA: hypothetical protein VK645_19430 [Chitinophagaceae bacterium]|nr:hypothetical protein [Chitinophagaceae bacterium]